MLTYAVHLTPDDNDTLLVTCPDLPEVTSFGEDEQDALGYAVGAIEEALAARMAHKLEIPLPTEDAPAGLHPVRLSTQTALKVLLYVAMLRQGVSKAELARRMGIARQHADRLLNLNHASRLDALDAAFSALGQDVAVSLRDRAA